MRAEITDPEPHTPEANNRGGEQLLRTPAACCANTLREQSSVKMMSDPIAFAAGGDERWSTSGKASV